MTVDCNALPVAHFWLRAHARPGSAVLASARQPSLTLAGGAMAKRGRLTRDKGAVGNDINAIQAQESLKRIMEFLKLHPEQALAVHHALEAGFFVGKVSMELKEAGRTCRPSE